MTAVIEPILRLRRAMQVNDDLQSRLPSPSDRLVQVGCRTGYVLPLDIKERPVSDGNAYDVEASFLDFLEIFKLHEAVPVGFESLAAFGLTDLLAQRPLISDDPVVARMLPEDGGRYEADKLLIGETRSISEVAYGSSTSQPPMLTPRTLLVVELQPQETPRSSRELPVC